MQVTRIIALSLLVLASGCVSQSRYLEGSSLKLGLYVPAGGQLYGIQALSWLSGCSVDAYTNSEFRITREFQSSNDYFGVVHIREHTKTQIEPKQV